jgi:putative membrane protein
VIPRFPPWVYRSGDEPDPRFSLANERTFLAWIRTSLALFAAGVALEALPVPMVAWMRTTTAVVFIATGGFAVVQAWVGWARTERALRNATALPGSALSAMLGVGVLVGGLLLAAGLFG